MPYTVVVLSMYYWPEELGNAPYATELAEHLAQQGHNVTVVTGMPHYPEWRTAPAYRGRSRIEEERAGVRIVRHAHYVPTHQSAIQRAAYEASFLISAGRFRPRHSPDVVLGIVPTVSDGVLARLIAAQSRAAYGLIIQDLVGAAAAQSGITGGRAVASAVRQVERWMLARATVVAPVANAFVPYLTSLGVSSRRIEVLPNWSRHVPAAGGRIETRRSLGWPDNELIALHAGNMGLKQGLDQIVEAARLAEANEASIRFVLMGDGNDRERLEDLAKGAKQLEFRSLVSAAELPAVLAAADALLVSERSSVRDMSMPSKLTAYFAAGRPVVAAVDLSGATAREIQRLHAGWVVPAGRPAALIEALKELHVRPDVSAGLVENARRHAETALDPDAILARATEIVGRIARRTRVMRQHGGA